MNSFLKMFFAALLAIIVSGILPIIFFISLMGVVSTFSKEEVVVKDSSVLHISFPSVVVDSPSEDFSSIINPMTLEIKEKPMTILKVINAIERAKNDPKISGIFMELNPYLSIGMANMQEIRKALSDFKSSGKFIVSHNYNYSQGGYYLCSVSDRVIINNEGELTWKGLASEIIFYKGALDKLGIKPEIIRHGKYKSAVEPFLYEQMSSESREQIQSFLNSIWGNIVGEISQSRNIDSLLLQNYASALAVNSPEKAVELVLAYTVGYRDQAVDYIKTRLETENVEFISLSSYAKTSTSLSSANNVLSKNKIGLLYADGTIVDGKGGDGQIGSATLAKQIEKMRKDDNVKAVVLRVNSPGGSSIASEIIWRELKLTQAKKPLIVSMGSYAASGGYYISAPADVIVASPATITGSIGVFSVMFDASKALKDKLGITSDVVKTNSSADIGTIFGGLTPDQTEYFQKSVNRVYDTFVSHVAEGRNLSIEKVDQIAQGRVWSGEEALSIGLIDGFGGIKDAISIAADRAGVSGDFRVVTSPSENDPFSKFLNLLETRILSRLIPSDKGTDVLEQYSHLKNMIHNQGVQTVIPYQIEIH